MSRCIDLAARAQHLDRSTRPSEPGSPDRLTWLLQRSLDRLTRPSKPTSLDKSSWMPKPRSLDGLTDAGAEKSKRVDLIAKAD